MRNLETHIFMSARHMAQAVEIGRMEKAKETEKLRERLGTTVMLIGAARDALKQGLLPKAQEYLDLAEKAAREER